MNIESNEKQAQLEVVPGEPGDTPEQPCDNPEQPGDIPTSPAYFRGIVTGDFTEA